jgi:hypothetical protein
MSKERKLHQMKKRFWAAILCLCVVIGMTSIHGMAASELVGGIISPQWVNTQSISLNMSYGSGLIEWTGKIVGYPNTTKISVSYMLFKKTAGGSYTLVDSWTNLTTYSSYLNSTGSAAAVLGTYKLSMTGTVTSSTGVVESIHDSLEKTFS